MINNLEDLDPKDLPFLNKNLKRIDKGRTKVSLQSYAVVEGIPTFIMDLFILDSPMYSMTQLRKKF